MKALHTLLILAAVNGAAFAAEASSASASGVTPYHGSAVGTFIVVYVLYKIFCPSR